MKKTHLAPERNLVGKRVRKARRALSPSLSQDALAGKMAALGIVLDQAAVSRIESQTRYVMDFEAKALAKALKVSVAWLYGEG